MALYLVPLMIGTREIAFPRLAAFNYWVLLFGGDMIYIGLFLNIAPDAGWFSYVPSAGRSTRRASARISGRRWSRSPNCPRSGFRSCST